MLSGRGAQKGDAKVRTLPSCFVNDDFFSEVDIALYFLSVVVNVFCCCEWF